MVRFHEAKYSGPFGFRRWTVWLQNIVKLDGPASKAKWFHEARLFGFEAGLTVTYHCYRQTNVQITISWGGTELSLPVAKIKNFSSIESE